MLVICERALSCRSSEDCEHAVMHDTEELCCTCNEPTLCEDFDEHGEWFEVIVSCVPFH